MKIKKILQNIFKNFFQFLFKIVYGKVIYSNHNLEKNYFAQEESSERNYEKKTKKQN